MKQQSSDSKSVNRIWRLRAMGPLAPRFHAGVRLGSGGPDVTFVRLPFQRAPLFIVIAAVALAVFCIPYFSLGLFRDGGAGDSLSDLITTLFGLFWLLGWSVGVFLLLAVFLLLSFGTETLQLRPGWLSLRVEVLRVGLGADFRARGIEDLRYEALLDKARARADGVAWRGDHLAFTYGGQTIRLGSGLTESRARQLIELIEARAIAHSPEVAGAEPPESIATLPLPSFKSASAEAVTGQDHLLGSGLPQTSTLVLILANLVPLAGVFLAGWDIGDIMLVFWAESAIIGLYNLARMWVIGRWSVLLLGPFFVGHFGGFMAGHLLFIYTLFLSGPNGDDPATSQVIADFFMLWPALLGLFISHGISFRLNFLGRREYLGTTLRQQMSAPYRRIIIMHVTIIFGGFLTLIFDAPVLALVLLIALKIAVDTAAHTKEHQGARRLADRTPVSE